MGIANQLITKSKKKLQDSGLNINKQVAHSLCEVDDIKIQIHQQIRSEWGVIDIAMSNIMDLTDQLHITEKEGIVRRMNNLKY